MTGTTNVPGPTFGPAGYVAPSEPDILAGALADLNAAFGGGLNVTTLSTPQGQIASSTAALVGAVNDAFLFVVSQFDPAFAQGRAQDALGRLYFQTRIAAEPTVLQGQCIGLPGVVIPVSARAGDQQGNVWVCTGGGTIGSGGNITLSFEAAIPGPTAVPSSNALTPLQTIGGWDSIVVLSGVVGRAVESRADFESRRQQSVAANASGWLPAIVGAVYAVAGVLDVLALENTQGTDQTIKGVTLIPRSIFVAVIGGLALDVATAIWKRKAPGAGYNGNTTVLVTDANPLYQPPFPAYSVTFQIPTGIPILFVVSIANSAAVPSNALALIQAAIIAAAAGADGGSRARIGGTVYASRYYAVIAALGSWAQIVSIKVGNINAAGASFTAAIVGTVMTVTAVASGALAPGQTLFDAGAVAPGTRILTQTSGSTGSTGTYTVNIVQAVSSEAMLGVIANLDDVPVNGDQVPSMATPYIQLALV